MAFTQVPITGTYQTGDGLPATGAVTFTPVYPLRNVTAASETTVAATVRADVVAGALSAITLAATDDPGTTPTGGGYDVVEYIDGAAPYRYQIEVPAAAGTIDLDTHPRTGGDVPPELVFPVPGPAGPQGDPGPTGAPGADGTDGVDGRTILNGAGAPAPGLGADGDFYIDTTADAIYGPKTAGAWGSATPLVGPQGPPGTGSVDTVNGDPGPAVVLDAADVGAVPTARQITAGTGLTGGGDLTADRSLAVSYGASAPPSVGTGATGAATTAARSDHTHSGVPTTRQITAGTGLTGGGSLAADRSLAVAYGSAAGTAVQGNDARVTADQAAATASIRTLGTGAQQAAAGNDTRITGAVQAAIMDAKGDLIVGTAADTVARVAVGTDGRVLAAASAQAAGVEYQANPTPAPVVLTDTASVPLDAAAGRVFELTATGNRTIAAPSNPADGRGIIIAHTASGGARTLALTTGVAGGFAFGTDIAALSATTSGLTDYIGAIYEATAQRWRVVSYAKGY